MTVTVRFDDELLALLDRVAARRGVDRSEVIRRAVRAFCDARAQRAPASPADLAADLLGCLHGGRADRSRTPRATLARLIHDRARRRAH
ncbi:MAG: ribbon-helix-helix protein, CopG family [Deltaproteobacteria bacterium]|nr:ribbon-helix-helix protein, CopG family [Deltaproteobacteria bacterium]